MENPEQKPSLIREARVRTLGFIVAALGFVAGLAWNDAVQSLIQHFIKLDANSIWTKFLYAIFITIIAVILIIYLEKLSKGKEN